MTQIYSLYFSYPGAKKMFTIVNLDARVRKLGMWPEN